MRIDNKVDGDKNVHDDYHDIDDHDHNDENKAMRKLIIRSMEMRMVMRILMMMMMMRMIMMMLMMMMLMVAIIMLMVTESDENEEGNIEKVVIYFIKSVYQVKI